LSNEKYLKMTSETPNMEIRRELKNCRLIELSFTTMIVSKARNPIKLFEYEIVNFFEKNAWKESS
jgi:hypothetical protein